jgi:PiT family inorganic phosphate transporter
VDLGLLAAVAVVALAFLFDFTNGFHDAANSVSTVVATRALPARWAVWFSALFNVLALFVVGTAVASTVATTVKPGVAGVAVVFSALVAAISWNYATWWIGMPSSSSHALIGGLVGAGLAAGGLDAITWGSVEKAALAIVVSPLVAFGIAFVAMRAVDALHRLTRLDDASPALRWIQLGSAAAVSFGHGANDAQKTMGVVAALLVGTGHLAVNGSGSIDVPFWVEAAAYVSIAAGTVWGGWKIIETMGLRITRLRPQSAVAANIGALTAIFGATGVGAPISTTQAAASSVAGSGLSSGAGVQLRVLGEMVLAWAVTLPVTVALAFGVQHLTALPGAWSVLAVGSLVVVVGSLIVWAMRHSLDADDLEAELPGTDVVLTQAVDATA